MSIGDCALPTPHAPYSAFIPPPCELTAPRGDANADRAPIGPWSYPAAAEGSARLVHVAGGLKPRRFSCSMMTSTAFRKNSVGGVSIPRIHSAKWLGVTFRWRASCSSPPKSSAARLNVLAYTVGTGPPRTGLATPHDATSAE